MHDEEKQAILHAYLDGQLSPTEAQAVQAHLETCETCAAALSALRQVDEALATMPVLPEPPGLTARIMARVASPTMPAFRLRWEDAVVSAALAWAAAATLLVLVLAWPQDSALPGAYLQRLWWTWVPWLDRLWYTLRVRPVYVAGALSSVCLAAASALCAAILARWAMLARWASMARRTIRARKVSSLRPRRS
jgi:anti-sigma factor RsiW